MIKRQRNLLISSLVILSLLLAPLKSWGSLRGDVAPVDTKDGIYYRCDLVFRMPEGADAAKSISERELILKHLRNKLELSAPTTGNVVQLGAGIVAGTLCWIWGGRFVQRVAALQTANPLVSSMTGTAAVMMVYQNNSTLNRITGIGQEIVNSCCSVARYFTDSALLFLIESDPLHLITPERIQSLYCTDHLAQLELEYVKRKPVMWVQNQEVCKQIENLIGLIRTSGFPNAEKIHAEDGIRGVRDLLDFPLTETEFQPILWEEVAQPLSDQLKARGIRRKSREPILNFCWAFVKGTAAKDRKNIIMLDGHPGTGKTTIAEDIGRILGVDVVCPATDRWDRDHLFGDADSRKPGFIATELIQRNRRTKGQGSTTKPRFVLFVINDGHHFLNGCRDEAALKEFFDSERPGYFDQGLGLQVNSSWCGVFITVNGAPRDEALNDRFAIVPIGNYSKEYRRNTTRNRFLPECLAQVNKRLPADKQMTDADITDQDIDAVLVDFEESDKEGFRGCKRRLRMLVESKARAKEHPEAQVSDSDSEETVARDANVKEDLSGSASFEN